MQCRAYVSQLGRHAQLFSKANTQVIIILDGDLGLARKYASSLNLPYPVLADPQREIYHRYGLHMGMLFLQRSASILVDRKGVIRYIKKATNPLTWLEEARELLDAVKAEQLAGDDHLM